MGLKATPEIRRFVQERDEAFRRFVMQDDFDAIKRYCARWCVPFAKDERIMKGAVYKAVQECTDLSDEVKALAREKCHALGLRCGNEG